MFIFFIFQLLSVQRVCSYCKTRRNFLTYVAVDQYLATKVLEFIYAGFARIKKSRTLKVLAMFQISGVFLFIPYSYSLGR